MTLEKSDFQAIKKIVDDSAEETKNALRKEIQTSAELTKKELRQDIQLSAEETKNVLRKEIQTSAESTKKELHQDIQTSVGGAEKRIIAVITREVSDLAEINRVVIDRVDKIYDLEKRIVRIEHKMGITR